MDTVKVDSKKMSNVTVHVSIEMPFNILSIESPSHKIKMKVLTELKNVHVLVVVVATS